MVKEKWVQIPANDVKAGMAIDRYGALEYVNELERAGITGALVRIKTTGGNILAHESAEVWVMER
jgi:hypothetical protein